MKWKHRKRSWKPIYPEGSMNLLRSKLLLIIIAACCAGSSVAQNDSIVRLAPVGPSKRTITIEGVVTDCQNKVPIEGVTVNILGSDGYSQQVITDKAGFYSVKSPAHLSYVISTEAQTARRTTYAGQYLNSSEKGKITPGSTTAIYYKKNFCLTPATCGGYYFPVWLFDKNAISYTAKEMSSYERADSSLSQLAAILKDNPSIVIEISGHASSDESKAQKLSEDRALQIKSDLVKQGITEDRIVCKGYSYERLLIKDSEIAKLKTGEEKEMAHSKNRRVAIKVIRWDYPVPGGY